MRTTRTAISTTILTLGLMFGLAASAQAVTTSREGSIVEQLTGPGNANWTNIINVIAGHTGFAEANLNEGNHTTRPVFSHGFGFTVPSNATGLTVSTTLNVITLKTGHVTLTAQLMSGGVPVGPAVEDHYEETGVPEPQTIYLPTSLTPAQVNGSSFGVAITASRVDNPDVGIGQVALTVGYTLPPWNWEDSHVKITGPTPVLAWGKPTLTSGTNSWSCDTTAIATVRNEPTGGVGGFAAWQTSQPTCEAPVCEAKGDKGFVKPTGEVNWAIRFPETNNPLVRITGIAMEAGCQGSTEPFSQTVTGSLTPTLENGTGVGYAPARLQFGIGPPPELTGEARVSGNLKLMGFEGGEIVGAKQQ